MRSLGKAKQSYVLQSALSISIRRTCSHSAKSLFLWCRKTVGSRSDCRTFRALWRCFPLSENLTVSTYLPFYSAFDFFPSTLVRHALSHSSVCGWTPVS